MARLKLRFMAQAEQWSVNIREWFPVQMKTAKPGSRKIPSVDIHALMAARGTKGENARRTGHSTLQ
jgi:hypothetical protein